jgi:hypothetical protein
MNFSKPKAVGKAMPDCPVCGKTTYSRGGIHPQCASQRAAKIVRAAHLEAEEKTGKVAAIAQPRQQWTKQCGKCKRLIHVRCAVCECGFAFPKKVN